MVKALISGAAFLLVLAVVGAWGQGYIGRVDMRKELVDQCRLDASDRLTNARDRARAADAANTLIQLADNPVERRVREEARSESASAARDFMSRTGIKYDKVSDILFIHASHFNAQQQIDYYCQSVVGDVRFFGDSRQQRPSRATASTR